MASVPASAATASVTRVGSGRPNAAATSTTSPLLSSPASGALGSAGGAGLWGGAERI
jgi:hypothetical protein